MFSFALIQRSTGAFLLSVILALSLVCAAAADSTTRQLGTNFTLVNLNNGGNQVYINYYKPDGSRWFPSEYIPMSSLGEQIVRTQYLTANLAAGKGSITVDASGLPWSIRPEQGRLPIAPKL